MSYPIEDIEHYWWRRRIALENATGEVQIREGGELADFFNGLSTSFRDVRNAGIVAAHLAGESYVNIGARTGLGRSMVQKICAADIEEYKLKPGLWAPAASVEVHS